MFGQLLLEITHQGRQVLNLSPLDYNRQLEQPSQLVLLLKELYLVSPQCGDSRYLRCSAGHISLKGTMLL